MSMGGQQTTQTSQKIPEWLENASRQAVNQSQQAAGIGYVPYQGPSVAAFNPMQQASFDGANQAAAAYGMPTSQGTGLPPPTTYANGQQGYSGFGIYEQALAALKQSNPQQYAGIMGMFNQPPKVK